LPTGFMLSIGHRTSRTVTTIINLTQKDNFMTQANKGDRVKINFTGRLEDGTVFDSTAADSPAGEEGPLELVIGDEEFFIPVEAALIGMAPGEKKTVNVPSDDAFGDYDGEYVFTIDRSQLPDDLQPETGMELELTDENDQSLVVTVTEVTDKTITFDANHPLAGEDLVFDIELVEIV
jgi:peptidylprolyl isomerase